LVGDDVRDLKLDGVHVKSAGKEPVIVFRDVLGVTLTNSPPPPKAAQFIKTLGRTQNIQSP
jgi:hypothetical protein